MPNAFDRIADFIGNNDGWTKRVPRRVLLAMLRDLQREVEEKLVRERDEARADAAVLHTKLNELLNEIEEAEDAGCWPKGSIVDSGWRLDQMPHPGAALLGELAAARMVVDAARSGDRGNIGDALNVYDRIAEEAHRG